MFSPIPLTFRTRLILAGSAAVMALGIAGAASAQQVAADPAKDAVALPAEPAVTDGSRGMIIVIGNRSVLIPLQNLQPETTYDEDDVAGLGVGTVGEALDEVRNQNGDEDPAVLVNGRPVRDQDEIANLPVEAVVRIEVLPRGSASRANGAPGQRAYNVVLRSSVKQGTLTASREEATEGGWGNTKGEAQFTWIKGQDRVNLSLRGAKSGSLFENERDFIPRTEFFPTSPIGNILPFGGTEVDPALSALFGQPVTTVALPAGQTAPTLAALLPGANQINPSEISSYRTLRGEVRPIDLSLTGNKSLNSWLSFSFNGRLSWMRSENSNGLPTARFLVPATNPFTPFSTPVYLAINDPARPLRSEGRNSTQSFAGTFSAFSGDWRASLTGQWDRREQTNLSRFTGSLGSLSTVAPTLNPFSGTLAGMIPISERHSISRYTTSQVAFEIQGPVVALWAGPLVLRSGLSNTWISFVAEDPSGPRQFKRTELVTKGGLTLPLFSRQNGFLGGLGEGEFELDFGRSDLGSYGVLNRRSLALNWQPASWLRLVVTDIKDERAVSPELLASPAVSTPNVPYFDPLTGQTVDVTLIYGGAAGLRDEESRNRTVALTLTPARKYNLQINLEYSNIEQHNEIGPLPPATTPVVLAFPDRFVRDANGTLILVDSRSVNFAREDSEQLRIGLRFSIPLSQAGTVRKDASGKRRRTPALKFDFNLTHTIILNNHAIIRAGLPEVDLLAGGAIGIGGGQARHNTRAGLSLTRGGTGVRVDYSRRGASYLSTGTLAAPDLLNFGPLATFDLRAFTDLGDIFPATSLLKGTRLSLVVDNVTNRRQTVTNQAGEIPQAYQPIRRDPVGRTVLIELRKTF